MAKRSAGILLYRYRGDGLELLLLHPGGPFWAKKDLGAWSIPKGEIDQGEDAEKAARREFEEETSFSLSGALTPLGVFKQPSGKLVSAFAGAGDVDLMRFQSNLCEIEWPPKNGRRIEIPDADRAEWFAPEEALRRVGKGQRPIVEALIALLAAPRRC
jgi:predicted NUDIX family NTP pyrophosphohydrolase